MADSKAVSIRIPDELLAKIDKLAEEKYTSIKGKPNRSLVIQSAIVSYFATVSDSLSSNTLITPIIDNLVTLSDTVDIEEFRILQDLVEVLSRDVRQLKKSSITLSDTVTKVEKIETEIIKPPDHTQLSVLNVEETEKGLTAAKLAARFDLKPNDVTSKKSKSKTNPEIFVRWSKSKDPEGQAWAFRENSKLFYRVPSASLNEGEAEAQTNHP